MQESAKEVSRVADILAERLKNRYIAFVNAIPKGERYNRWAKRIFDEKIIDARGLTDAQRQAISAKINANLFFSARTTNEMLLEDMKRQISMALDGRLDVEDFISKTKSTLGLDDALNFSRNGSIDKRLKLIYDTNKGLAEGEADYIFSTDEIAMGDYPCKELVRVEQRKEPRDWVSRWAQAGGKFYDGRMIARVDDSIWYEISRFGAPYPPFDYNSGMGWESVSMQESVELGVLDKQEAQEIADTADYEYRREVEKREIEEEMGIEDAPKKKASKLSGKEFGEASRGGFVPKTDIPSSASVSQNGGMWEFKTVENSPDEKASEELAMLSSALLALYLLRRKKNEEQEQRVEDGEQSEYDEEQDFLDYIV